MIKRFIFILCFILTSILSPAVTYYISSTGNDNSNGISTSTPWRTISKVNSRTLVAGDVILFERGGTYRGSLYINQSGTTTSPITISTYGSGNLPVFLGSQLTSNWIVHQGNIWKTQVSATRMAHLFYNDSILPIARFPNTGWLRNDIGTSTQINDSQLNQPAGYWNGATVVVRSTAWSYDTARVTSYSPGVINMTSIVYDLSTYNWGYFIRNKLELLDTPGEWFFDRATSTLYLYPITSNPNLSTIEVVTAFQAGDGCGISVNWQRSNVVIENIAFKHYGYAGVSTSGSNNITVRNCTFDQCDDGIRAYGNGQIFSNNVLTRCRQIGINSISGGTSPSYGNNNFIENNTITDCAIYPGLGKSTWGYFGLSCTGFNNIVRGNRLTRIGYIALSFSGNCLVENNVIDNACYALSDGSGIAFDNTDGAIVRNNIVLSTLGNVESCATNFTGCDPKGKGIYFGNISNKNNIIEGNTVAYCNGAGIWFDHTMVQTGNQIRNNTLFGNNLYQFGASDYSNYNGPGATSPYAVSVYPNQSVTGNIFYSNTQSQKTMYHINRWFSGVDFADFNNNKYINPWDSTSIQVWNIAGTGTNLNYSLSQWRNVRNDDLLSTNQPYIPQSTSNDHILVYNVTSSTQSTSLPSGTWRDLDGVSYQSTVQLDPLKSKTLYKLSSPPPPPPPIQIPPTTTSTNASLLVQTSTSANSITVSWVSYANATGYTIHRKPKTSTSWGTALATLPGTVTQYTDNTAIINTYYEYRVTRTSSVGSAYGYVASAIQLAPIEYRGKMVLVIDNTFTSTLSNQLTELQNDLKNDGWNVIRIDVSRSDTPANVKAQIQTIYNSDPTNVKSVLLLGHIPVYRSGNIAPDGHSSIPWACDAYYGEMTSTWSSPPSTLSSDVELEVGRIDLFNLPAFSNNEQQLLSNYLTKLHNYKIGQFTAQNRMLIQENLSYVTNPLAETAYRTGGPLVGAANVITIPAYNSPNYVSRMPDSWLWGYYSGGGSFVSADGIGTTTSFTTNQNNVIFGMSFGSYFGNWDCSSNVPNWNNNTNNLLRATIANGQALTNVWAGQPNWFFHHMGMGDPIGYSVKTSMNNRVSSSVYLPQNGGWLGQGYTTIHLGLMGDPSLRMNYINPPSNLSITANGSNLTFSWTPSTQSVEGYYLYQIVSGVPIRIHPELITSNTITGVFPNSSGTEYMVRAVRLENNTSGSYYNLSLGTTAVVPQVINATLAVKLFLQGPFNGTNMNDNLRSLNLIPLSDPYPTLGYVHVGSSAATTTSAVLSVTGNNAIVDWILVEIRSATTPTQRLYTTAALLQKDGDIVSTNGVSPLSIPLINGNYYIAVKHRNHLGVMTANPVNLIVGTTLNFNTIPTWGTAAMNNINGVNVLWAGDASFDGVLKYTGENNDRDFILNRIGGTTPTNIVNGYHQEDINLSGSTIYTGVNNDRDIILLNIGGTVPTNTRSAQLP